MLLARRLVASKTPSQVSSKTVLGGKIKYWHHDGRKAEERTFVHGKEKDVLFLNKMQFDCL
jgi:hypothetical protein